MGTPEGGLFKFPILPDEGGNEEPEAPEASQQAGSESEPAETPETEPETPAAPEGGGEPAAEGEGEGETEGDEEEGSEEPGPLYAKRYGSIEALEQGYGELQGAFTRVGQELAYVKQSVLPQYDQALKQMAAMLQQVRAAQDPEFAEQVAEAEKLRPLVDAQTAPLRQQLEAAQQEMAVQRAVSNADQVVNRFFTDHPDVEAGSDDETHISNLVQRLGLSMFGEGNLDRAYEAAQDDVLEMVLVANPHWARSDNGFQYAKFQAEEIRKRSPQNQGTEQPGKPGKRVVRKGGKVYVETGGNGVPTPSPPGQLDEAEAALAAWEAHRKGETAFGV